MHILWVGKAPDSGQAGDEVFDRRAIAALEAKSHSVTKLHPRRVAPWREVTNLLKGVPYYRSRFESPQNRAMVKCGKNQYDLTICSWEPLDILALHMPQPVVLIAHNVSSLAIRSIFPTSRLARLAARQARAWETRTYTKANFVAIAALTVPERNYIADLPGAPRTLLTVPGMPRTVPLDEVAVFKSELVILGTFDWIAKRRDLTRFVQDYIADSRRLPVLSDSLPSDIGLSLRITPAPDDLQCAQAIRIGIITDRFEAGHKLKTLAYIARNHIVVSYSDVTADFVLVPDHSFFIRKVKSTPEIASIADEFRAHDPTILRHRFLCFQARCRERFTWESVADQLTAAIAA
jgi:hypothetical protein